MNWHQLQASFAKQSFLAAIGAKLEYAGEGTAIVSCPSREDLKQQTGVLHAGVLSTVADVACGYAAMSLVPEAYSVVSVEFKVNLLRPASGSKITATGRVIKPGKTLIVVEADVVDDDTGKAAAKMTGTMMVIKDGQ